MIWELLVGAGIAFIGVIIGVVITIVSQNNIKDDL